MTKTDEELITLLNKIGHSDKKFVEDILFYARTDEERQKMLNLIKERNNISRNDAIYEAFKIGAKRMGVNY